MIRPLIILLLLAGVALAAMFLADRPGTVTINWAGYRIEASLVILALAAILAAVAAWVLARLWSWAKGGTPLSPERRGLRRKQKGLNEVDAALSALAAGDGRKALSLGENAIKHLDGAGVAYLVSAQAATACGKDDVAERYFDALAKTKHGKFLGLRGRVSEARRLGQVSKALELSEQALTAAPRSDWALVTAFELETKLGKWGDAQTTLKKAIAKSIFDQQLGARHLGAIRYGEAVAAQQEGRMADAVRHAKQALAVRPNFVPAAVLAAQLYKAAGKLRAANKVIEKTWKLRPHHALAECYAALLPMETPQARMARFEKLNKLAPDHSESQIRLAEAAFNAGDYSRAETVLAPHLVGRARARAGKLMGQIAAAKGDDARERAKWVDLAASGAPEPAYECAQCRAQWAYWTSHCAACGSFNAFVWDPPARTIPAPSADPLSLVGSVPRVTAIEDADAPIDDLTDIDTKAPDGGVQQPLPEEKSGT
ncbi:MAG: heme biosynthesis HemY N-terminal domain-containing protein [Pseudomonadota bacterium]